MKKACLLTLFMLLVLGAYAKADTLFVDPDGGAYTSITDALAAAQDGDEIILAGGVYDASRESFPILVNQSVILRAEEGETPVIASPVLLAAMKIYAPGTQVEGISFQFMRFGIWVLADDVRVSGCTLALADETWRTSSTGMWLGGSKRVTLTDNVFEGCGIALAGPPISESSKGIPVLTAMFEVGEDIEYFTTHTIENNIVNDRPLRYLMGLEDTVYSEPSGQIIAVECSNVVFQDIDVSRASIGLQFFYCDGIRINRVIADDSGVFGIYAAKSKNCFIENVRANRSAHAIDARDVHHSVIANCIANDCGQGIFLSWSQNCLVTDSEMINCGTGFFSASGNNNHVNNCLISGNELGMYIQHEPVFTLTHSEIEKNTACGARVTYSGFLAWNNSFDENWVACMTLHCNPVTLNNNTFSGNQDRALFMKDSTVIKLISNQFSSEDALLKEFVDSQEPLILE